MGVRAVVQRRLARPAARRPHLLLAVAPGATAARLAVERQAVASDAVISASPSDADVLVVVGEPGRELAAAVDRVWGQMPGPRARAHVVHPDQVRSALGAAVGRLADDDHVREAAGRTDEWHDGGDHGGGDPGGGHHGGSGMDMPGGLMMAERADDRDGLKLDVLHVPLGPVLADWPAGLVVDVVLQGDVVQHAHARVLAPARPVGEPYWTRGGRDERRRRYVAARLDSLGRLLAVAGWEAAATASRRLRDDVLTGTDAADVAPRLARLDRRVGGSRLLRWSTEGLGVQPDTGEDVTARYRRWLTEARGALTGHDLVPDPTAGRDRLDLATRLMVGLDLAAARLVLASFDPDPDALVAGAPAPVHTGDAR
ncbi:MAG TPA: hypothetical protein VF054_00235 [Micromonosporaceae bacterium]